MKCRLVYIYTNSCRTLRHVVQYSPLLPLNETLRNKPALSTEASTPISRLRDAVKADFTQIVSQYPLLKSGAMKLNVPVYVVWGSCEDVHIIEEFRTSPNLILNLFIVDENQSGVIQTESFRIRLLGLGGAVVMHKIFDVGEGKSTIAGGGGTMWCTALQMGELLDTGMACWDRSEVRIFVTSSSIGRDGMLTQLALALRADFTLSAGLHFRYCSSYNEFSVHPHLDHFRGKLAASRKAFDDVWFTVKDEVEKLITDGTQKRLLKNIQEVVNMMPDPNNISGHGAPDSNKDRDAILFKNVWHFNLSDVNYGSLVFVIQDGKISSELFCRGFNFAHRLEDGQRSAANATRPNNASTAQQQSVSQFAGMTNSTIRPSQTAATTAQVNDLSHPHRGGPTSRAPASKPSLSKRPEVSNTAGGTNIISSERYTPANSNSLRANNCYFY